MTMQQFLMTTFNTMKPGTVPRGVRWAVAGLVAVGIALIAAATPAAAETIVVDDPSDEVGATGMTLRKALDKAEASPQDDLIVFADDVSVIHLTQGELWFGFFFEPPNSGALTIDGRINGGQDRVRIDGGNQSGVLVVGSGTVLLSGLELVNGKASIHGGGLMVWEIANVRLEDSLIYHNYAKDAGGGIYNQGVLTISDTDVVENNTGNVGGGLFTYGKFGGVTEATNTRFLDNNANAAGGGIFNQNAVVTLINPTVSGNTARNGGGIYNDRGPLSLSGGEFSGNQASRKGNDVYYTSGSIDPADLVGLDVYEEQPKGGGQGGGHK